MWGKPLCFIGRHDGGAGDYQLVGATQVGWGRGKMERGEQSGVQGEHVGGGHKWECGGVWALGFGGGTRVAQHSRECY